MAATTLNPIVKTHPGIEDRIAQYRLSLPIIVCVVWLGGCATHRPCPVSPIPNSTIADHACRIDGCTLAPDFDFAACCDAHDVAYWQGGNAEQRLTADRTFRQCIVDRDRTALASVYYRGVRLGGVGWLPTPWRWGFGWNFPRTAASASDACDGETEADAAACPDATPNHERNGPL